MEWFYVCFIAYDNAHDFVGDCHSFQVRLMLYSLHCPTLNKVFSLLLLHIFLDIGPEYYSDASTCKPRWHYRRLCDTQRDVGLTGMSSVVCRLRFAAVVLNKFYVITSFSIILNDAIHSTIGDQKWW